MFLTHDIDKAIRVAEKMQDRAEDVYTDTRKLVFKCNGDIKVAAGKKEEPLQLDSTATRQVARLLHIPPAWIDTKQKMEDPENLQESFNRHTKMLGSQGIVIRYWKSKDGKEKHIRAIFPDNYVLYDIPECLQAIKETIGDKVTEWPFISINEHSLRCMGLVSSPKIRKIVGEAEGHKIISGVLPGVHAYCSETGAYPIGVDLGLYRAICENTASIMYEDFKGSNMKRVEKTEGAFPERFKELLKDMRIKALPAFARETKKLTKLAEYEIGKNRLRASAFGLTLCKMQEKHSEAVTAAWPAEDNSLFGLWNGITRYADVLSKKGSFKSGHDLQKAAGRLTMLSDSQLQAIVGAS